MKVDELSYQAGRMLTRHRMTHQRLADILGLSQPYVTRFLNGKRAMGPKSRARVRQFIVAYNDGLIPQGLEK